jgi:HlyD family secretion protein
MKKATIILLSVLVVVAATGFWYFKSNKKVKTVSFVTARAQLGYVGKSVTATGTIEPVDTVSVGAQVSGVVKKVYVDFNSAVKKGQLLAQVDASIFLAQNQESKANLASAKSNLLYQQSTYDRQHQLYALGAISKADYQVALNQYYNAKAAVDNAGAQVRVTGKTLSYTNIYSPVNGVVLNRNVSAGQTIASSFNAPVLFVIAKDLTKMQVNADVDEADIGGVQAGQHVHFTVDAFPDDLFRGTVQEILLHPSVSANVVTYSTRINVDNAAMKLKPGMTASINIYTEEDSNALLIPLRAISFKPDSALLKQYKIIKAEKTNRYGSKGSGEKNKVQGNAAHRINQRTEAVHPSYVWIKSGDTLTEKKILTGLADDVNVKVIRGLKPGDEVITNMITDGVTDKTDDTQRSPFTPQMRRSSGGSRNR